MAQGKGLTPNKLQYKLLTGRGVEVWRSAPYVGLRDCIAGFNTTHSPSKAASYDKAYRELRTFGSYSEMFLCKYNPDTMKVETAILVVMPVVGYEVGAQAVSQVYELEGQQQLFAPAQTLAECGALAQAINRGTKDVQLSEAQAVKLGTLAFHSFLSDYTGAVGFALAQAAAACTAHSSRAQAQA